METSYKPVVETYVRKTKELIHFIIGGKKVVTTPEHPFYVVGAGFVAAALLCIGTPLVDVEGKELSVEQIYREDLGQEEVSVYNFQVEDWHTYHVSDVGVLVHNAGVGYGEEGKGPSETSYGKSSNNFLNGESFKELSRDDAREVVSNLLDNGEINIDDLQSLVPEDVPNTFVATDTIKDGAKYEFTLADGQKVIIRWHEPDPVAASKYPGCVSGSRYTAEIKVGNKQLKANGGWSRNQAINDVHVPIKGK